MTPAEDATKLPDYRDCILSLHAHGSKGSTKLVAPEWQIIGGRLFIVGKLADNLEEVEPLAGTENAVAWDEVDNFLVFRSIEEYERRMFPNVQKTARVVALERPIRDDRVLDGSSPAGSKGGSRRESRKR